MLNKTKKLLEDAVIKISILQMTLFYLSVIILGVMIGIIYQLNIPFLIFLILMYLFIFPFFHYQIIRSKNEKKRFEDVTLYMEQLICSFKRGDNVVTCLEDCLSLFGQSEKMYKIIANALILRKTGKGVDGETIDLTRNLTKEAFRLIENEYPSRRLALLHSYIIKAEENGGKREHGLDIQLKDIQAWKNRTYIFQKKRNNIRIEVLISTIMTAVLCYATKLMTPKSLGLALEKNISYQIVTTFVFVCFGFILYFTYKKLAGTWLDSKELDEKQDRIMIHRYQFIKNYNNILNIKESLPIFIVCGTASVFFFIFNNFVTGMIRGLFLFSSFVFILFCCYTFVRRKTNYIKMVRNNLEKEFPYWLLETTLLLQQESVYNAISISSSDKTGVLKIELDKLLEGIYKSPNSLSPFTHFYYGFHALETQTGMKVLYSVNVNGYEEVERQLDFLAEQNNVLLDTAERIRFQNQLGGLSLVKMLPLLLGVLKMMVDLGGVLLGVMNLFTSFA